jgi:hypothetical protein
MYPQHRPINLGKEELEMHILLNPVTSKYQNLIGQYFHARVNGDRTAPKFEQGATIETSTLRDPGVKLRAEMIFQVGSGYIDASNICVVRTQNTEYTVVWGKYYSYPKP